MNLAMKFFSMLFVTLLLSCGQNNALHIEEPFIKYVTMFENTYNITNTISITFTDKLSSNEAIGTCYLTENRIEILLSFWEKTTELRKTSLIFHELGHCIFNWDHDDRMDEEQCYVNFMSSYIDTTYCLNKIFNNGVYKQK